MDDDNATAASRTNFEYMTGSIVKMSLQNFLTYDQCTFHFNPKLNVIIGPNGTGKSSVVCGICLGLAGKTNYLGRAKDLADFVKHGKEKAVIEIELANPPKNEVIRRELNKGAKCVSTWYHNGTQVSNKHIEELVAKFNIQLSNLCQFLAQERVADFAKMNKIELLENTELAICTPQMQEDHKWLKQFRNLQKDLEVKKTDDQSHLEKLIQMNQRVEREVMRYKERAKLIEQLNILDQKKAWTVYEMARQEYLEHKQGLQVLQKKRSDAEKESVPLAEKSKQLSAMMNSIDRDIKNKKGEELKAAAAATKRLHDQISEKDEKVTEKWDEYKEAEKDEKERAKKEEQCKMLVAGWQNELDNLHDEEVQPNIDRINQQMRDNMRAITQVEQEISQVNERVNRRKMEISACEHKRAELSNMNKRRLQMLQRQNKNCYNAIMWLRQNKHLFRGVIHEPIMLLLNMKDPRFAELCENHVARRDMHAFVCEDGADNERFIKEVREKLKLKVNVVRAPRNTNGQLMTMDSYRPRKKLDDLKQWGFTSYMRELFDAPDSVMAFLCKQYRIHEIPIGSERTKQIVEQVTRTSNVDLFYIPTMGARSPGCRYSVKRSKYGSNSVVGNSALRRAQYLDIKVDPDELRTIENKIQEMKGLNQEDAELMKDLGKRRQQLEKTDNDLRAEKKDLHQLKNRRKNLENKIMVKKNNLEDLERNRADMEVVKQQTQAQVSRILNDKKNLAVKFVNKIESCVNLSVEKGMLQANYSQHLRMRMKVEQRIRDIKLKNVELLQAVERADAAKTASQQKAKQLLNEAKKKTGGTPDHMEQHFSKYPDDLAEIETLILEYGARVECCGNTDPKAFDEFNARKKEIESLQAKVSRLSDQLETRRDEMLVVRDRWLIPLKKLIAKVNLRFSRYFANMGCAGEVDLHADNPDEFDKYGIRIRVKFRAVSSLQELNPFRQSGGERSVSTMLYLVALQSMYTCPFRLVDEINQGMDPHNERRVFEVIVNSSAEESTSQYFLITPKLLPNLTYSRNMSVHIIYNGPSLMRHDEWKLSRFIRKRKNIRYDDD